MSICFVYFGETNIQHANTFSALCHWAFLFLKFIYFSGSNAKVLRPVLSCREGHTGLSVPFHFFTSTTRQRVSVAKVNISHLCTGGRFHGAGRSFDSISIPGLVTNCLLFWVPPTHRFHFSLRWLPWAWVGQMAPSSSVELFRQCSS